MSETYTSAFAGAGKARHRSWIMMVDMPGSKGCTCNVGRDAQSCSCSWHQPIPHGGISHLQEASRPGLKQQTRKILTQILPCLFCVLSPQCQPGRGLDM